MNTIVIGGGCFWCIEAVFQRVQGVKSIVSGYAGGSTENPTYYNHGDHAETTLITYGEKVVNLEKLLEMFFYTHDPTTLNRQGNDMGRSYRSIILCKENELILANKAKTNAQDLWYNKIVTEIKILDKFYPAEDYHQNYFNQNQNNPYCQAVINPKIAKFEKKFKEYFRD